MKNKLLLMNQKVQTAKGKYETAINDIESYVSSQTGLEITVNDFPNDGLGLSFDENDNNYIPINTLVEIHLKKGRLEKEDIFNAAKSL